MIKFKPVYFIGIFIALAILILDFYFFLKTRWFISIIILSINIGWLQFWYDFYQETKRQKEIELKFLEFTRALVETVKSGISIPKSILHVSNENYGSLTPYVKKLSNQINLGIPVHKALKNFAKDTNNSVIKRSISIIIEAESSGGDIEDVLESVSESVIAVKKMKEERKASTYSQIVQGYVVFFIFIIIMLILQLWLFPRLTEMQGSISYGLSIIALSSNTGEAINLDKIFFALILIQGFFAGIMVGKFSEGTLKNGLIHSIILMTTAALIITLIKGGI